MKKTFWLTIAASTLLWTSPTMIKDSAKGLMWEHTPQSKEIKRNFAQAQRYCAELRLGGFRNWRLPTLFEMLTIVDYRRYKPAVKQPFSFVKKEGSYWTTTPYASEANERWVVSFKDGAISDASENYDRYVRCVRNIEK